MGQHCKFSPVLITRSSAFITLSLVNALYNKPAANVPNSIERNTPFFLLFLIISLIHFTSNPHSSSDLIVFIISYISSFKIINAEIPNP